MTMKTTTKRLGLVLFGLGVMLCSTTAWADPSQGTPNADAGVVVHTIPTVTVYGRAPKPHVVIEITRPTAAREAGTAHESLRERLLADSIPPALRPQR